MDDVVNRLSRELATAMAAAVADLNKRQLQDVVAYVVDAFGLPEAPSLRQRFQGRPTESNSSKD